METILKMIVEDKLDLTDTDIDKDEIDDIFRFLLEIRDKSNPFEELGEMGRAFGIRNINVAIVIHHMYTHMMNHIEYAQSATENHWEQLLQNFESDIVN